MQIDGLEYLHSMNLVHRDIKPENVVFDETGTARLCDFGLAEIQGTRCNFGYGTKPYLAPELIDDIFHVRLRAPRYYIQFYAP